MTSGSGGSGRSAGPFGHRTFDRLAQGGLRSTNFTTTALRSPTRSCLVTGRNHHSVGMANVPELASGFPGGDSDQWYPKLFIDREAIDQPRLPSEGYHLSEDLAERTMSWLAKHKSLAPSKPWLAYLAFGAMHAPHHIWPEWADRYEGQFDMGWDVYREQTLARQKEMGIVPDAAELSPMLEGVQAWDSLSADEQRLFARMAEVYAGYGAHRRPDRPADRLPRRDRPARQHVSVRVRRRQRPFR